MLPPLLVLHIAAGCAALPAGAAALCLRKGSPRHRRVGQVYGLSMLLMSASGAYLAALKSQTINILVGALVFQLTLTAWSTGRRSWRIGWIERMALLLALVDAAALLGNGLAAPGDSDTGSYFVFGAIAALSAAGDIHVLWRGGIAGRGRVQRHVWRSGVTLLVAVISLFLGQAQVFPQALRDSHLLAAPVLLCLAALLYWVLRVARSRDYRQAPTLSPLMGEAR